MGGPEHGSSRKSKNILGSHTDREDHDHVLEIGNYFILDWTLI